MYWQEKLASQYSSKHSTTVSSVDLIVKTDQLRKKKERRILSLAADAIFCVTNGKSMPSKHVQLGLVIKSGTGSRKTLEILNRMGHCASYHAIEGLETELTYSTLDAQRLLPEGLSQLPNLHTGN